MEQHILNALVLGSVLTLFSLGLSLAWGSLDVLNMAHGALFVFGAFAAHKLVEGSGLPFLVGGLAAILGAGLLAMLMELTVLRRIRTTFPSRRQRELSTLVATVGLGTVIDEIVRDSTKGVPFGVPSFAIKQTEILGLNVSNIQIIVVVTTIVLAGAVDWFMRRSRQGRAIRTVAFDSSTAEAMGIRVNSVAAGTMFVSGALAGLAGLLVTLNVSGVDVDAGHQYLLIAFAVLIVGGVGSVRGAIAAAFLIAVTQTAVVAYGPAQWQAGVAFIFILVVLIFRPGGLFARVQAERS